MTPREMYEALRYQMAPVGHTTMGPCANGCGNYARGSGQCQYCLVPKLKESGYEEAEKLWKALRNSKVAILDAEDWLYEQEQAAIDAARDTGNTAKVDNAAKVQGAEGEA